MEQRATPSSSLLASATEDELIVSQILLDLRTLMSLSESLSNFNWGRRRRRSVLEPPQQPPAPLIAAPSRPAASPENRIEETRTRTTAEDAAVLDETHGGGAGTTASSPDTPHSFPPSESDEKPKRSSKKRSREKYLDMIDGLTQCQELLRGEVENVRKYYNKLKAYNLKLKAIKQKAEINLGMELAQNYRIPETDQQPLDCQQHRPGPALVQPSDDGLGVINNRSPLGIDLNLTAGEAFSVELYQPLDVSRGMIIDKRTRYAEARRKRIRIMKAKSSSNKL